MLLLYLINTIYIVINFVLGYDYHAAVETVFYYRQCRGSNLIKDFVTFHFYFPFDHMPNTTILTQKDLSSYKANCWRSCKFTFFSFVGCFWIVVELIFFLKFLYSAVFSSFTRKFIPKNNFSSNQMVQRSKITESDHLNIRCLFLIMTITIDYISIENYLQSLFFIDLSFKQLSNEKK